MSKKRLYLIDGANLLFRAFYAIRHLSNSKGQPTNALYGFANMLLKLMREQSPDYAAVCLDTAEPTFRDEIYGEYKANREEPPDELASQFPYVEPLVEALSMPIVKRPGFEADDLMGTLARRFAADGLEVVLVSGDKDLMQLVGPNVCMFDGMKGLWVREAEVKERFGVPPEGVADVLALCGDATDNVPGVKGVGPKTASRLVAEYGSVEGVIDNAGRIEGKVGRAIADHAEDARLSKRLVTIDINVELKEQLKDLEVLSPDREKVQTLFKELEFTTLLNQLAPQSALSFEGYRLVTEEKTLNELIKLIKNKGILSIDLETDSLDPMRANIAGFALAWGLGEAAYIPIGHVTRGGGAKAGRSGDLFAEGVGLAPGQLPEAKVRRAIEKILSDGSIRKVGQNLNYDLTILRSHGYEVRGVELDTMLASYLIDPAQGHGLDALASRYLDHTTIKYGDVTGKGAKQILFTEVPPEEARDYACEDADVALRLAGIFRSRIGEEGLSELFYDVEMPLLDVLVDMQIAGMRLDEPKLSLLGREFEVELDGLEGKIHALAGEEFNINSPRQLGRILFEKLRLPGGKRTKTGFSTGQQVLEELASRHELPALILRWRQLGKLKSTYIDSLKGLINPVTGRVHTTFNQATAATGRLSSSDPNLQNIPARTDEGRRIREAFVADPGFVLISADYSQIELRVLAHLSREGELIGAFERGEDVHALTASGIFGVPRERVTREQRAVGKTVNFATIYGQTSYGLAAQLGISQGEAADYIDDYFAKYPRVAAYRDEVLERARKEGMVGTLFGRRRYFPDIGSENGMLRQIAERMAFNTVFQGSAADIIKIAMIDVHSGLAEVSGRSRLLLQVHDELVIEAPEGEAEKVCEFVKRTMERAVELSVPLVVDTGRGANWAVAH
ncbi:MAG: DNA polymerase I [Proteobacteria bacterium]|nr:DNA polymerase I [Pseudomonadota bacterium]